MDRADHMVSIPAYDYEALLKCEEKVKSISFTDGEVAAILGSLFALTKKTNSTASLEIQENFSQVHMGHKSKWTEFGDKIKYLVERNIEIASHFEKITKESVERNKEDNGTKDKG